MQPKPEMAAGLPIRFPVLGILNEVPTTAVALLSLNGPLGGAQGNFIRDTPKPLKIWAGDLFLPWPLLSNLFLCSKRKLERCYMCELPNVPLLYF